MFTGIIEKQGHVVDLAPQPQSLQIQLKTGWNDLTLGESIAVNGVCLTVSNASSCGKADFFVSSETLERTNLGSLALGARCNLERALTLQTRLSGHWVQGHVDGKGKFIEVETLGENRRLGFEIPARLARYCVEKGSITIDGISLTINRGEGNPALQAGKAPRRTEDRAVKPGSDLLGPRRSFPEHPAPGRFTGPSHFSGSCPRRGRGDTFKIEVMIVPHTWLNTNLSTLKINDLVNIEVDVLAKYTEKMLEHLCHPSR